MKKVTPIGFTLVELLVAITVIGLLLAITIPIVGRVLRNSESSKCLSNLRQIGVAFQLYQNEYGHYPPSYISSEASGDKPSGWWTNQLRRYIPRQEDVGGDSGNTVFTCPTALHITEGKGGSHYSKNRQVGPSVGVENQKFISPLNVQRHAQIIFAADGVLNNNNNAAAELLGEYASSSVRSEGEELLPVSYEDFTGESKVRIRHGDHANAVFLDGHVESLTADEVRKKNFAKNY